MIAAMSEKIMLLASIILGAAGGIAWTDLPSAERASPRAGNPAPVVRPAASASDPNVHYSGCNEVRALGKAPLYSDQPGYRQDMDGDGDGIACEPHRRG
jgi:hypothetical protein